VYFGEEIEPLTKTDGILILIFDLFNDSLLLTNIILIFMSFFVQEFKVKCFIPKHRTVKGS